MAGLSWIEPELPTLLEKPPEGDEWIREIKYDGWRAQVIIDAGKARVFTRRGHDWTAKFRSIASEAVAGFDTSSAIVDGEVVFFDAQGQPDYPALRRAIPGKTDHLSFVAFDLLHVAGHDIIDMHCVERRSILQHIIQPNYVIRFSEHVETSGEAFFRQVDRMGLEGMVSKRADAPYRSGRSTNWFKTKCYETKELEIIGVQRERGKPAMALMAEQGRYGGGAFITANQKIRERLWARVQEKAGAKVPAGLATTRAEWLTPGLVGTVRTLKGEEKLRHASMNEWREE